MQGVKVQMVMIVLQLLVFSCFMTFIRVIAKKSIHQWDYCLSFIILFLFAEKGNGS